jgi:hypothetical protein
MNNPDHAERQRQIERQHVRPRTKPLNNERTEQYRRADAARNTERDGRNQRAGFVGVVRGFRCDDAANIPATELRLVLCALHGVTVSDPIDDRRAEARQHADVGADQGAADRQPTMSQHVPDALHQS